MWYLIKPVTPAGWRGGGEGGGSPPTVTPPERKVATKEAVCTHTHTHTLTEREATMEKMHPAQGVSGLLRSCSVCETLGDAS